MFATGIAVGDFDHDPSYPGALDVATSIQGSSEVLVFTGFNDGTLSESTNSIPLNGVPSGMIQGTFDAGTLDDLIVSEGGQNAAEFLKGLGSSDFFAPPLPGAAIGAGQSPAGLASADLDGNGTLDLVVANNPESAPGAITILLGHSDGTFTLQQQPNPDPDPTKVAMMPSVDSLPTGHNGTFAVAIGNIDADPGLDVLALNPNATMMSHGSISIFTSDGHGIFTPGGTLETGTSPQDLKLIDLNHDHKPDLIVANGDDDTVTVQIGKGDGTFGAAQTYTVGTKPTRLAVGDVDGDHELDIVVSNQLSADVSVLLGDGKGAFGPARTFVGDAEPQVLALGDFNADGLLDPVVATQGTQSGSVAVLVNRGGGSLHAVEDVRAGSSPQSLAVADLDGDGYPDVLASVNSSEVAVFPGRPSGFADPIRLTIGGTTFGVAAADLNGDERPDIVVVDKTTQKGGVWVALSQGGGRFAVPVFFQTESLPNAVAVGDFNGDGRPDLAVSTTGSQPKCQGGTQPGMDCVRDQDCGPQGQCPAAPGKVSVLLQQANGNFVRVVPDAPVDNEPIAIAVANVDCDANHYDDLLVANLASGTVSVLTSKGDGTFTLAQTLQQVGMQPVALVVADFNQDGVDDFAVADSSAPAGSIVHLFGGSCSGPFTSLPGTTTSPTSLARALVARDFTGDGNVDLALVNSSTNAVYLVTGVGNGKMNAAGSDSVSRMPIAVAAADFDLDGRYDAVTANNDSSSNNLSILYNCARDLTANGAPANCDPFGNPGPKGSAALRGDGNGDGLRSAADLVAVGREVMDGDGFQVEAIGGGSFKAKPGVDANGDGRVDAQDRLAVAHRIFGG